jgi:glucosamine--fructose-6-phosphate aminotransferase (isomerizing)
MWFMARSIPDLPQSHASSFDLPLIQEIESLPGLIDRFTKVFQKEVAHNLTRNTAAGIKRVYITGCGDSFHAGLSAALAFNQFSGTSCQAITAMQMARYTAAYIAADDPIDCLVIGVSSSGQVSRTIEALRLARKAGVRTLALTREADSPLGKVAENVIALAIPPIESIDLTDVTLVIPGMRSFMASLLGLYLVALHLGRFSGYLDGDEYDSLQHEIRELSQQQNQTIKDCKPGTEELAKSWADARHFEICGVGPNFGAAQFTAAKILEASGDTVVAQDLEEWAHLQYFGRHTNTPTLFISAGDRDKDRVREVIEAATVIGRCVAIVAPANSSLARKGKYDVLLPVAVQVRECFSPALTCIPGTLLAAYRSEQIGETYFRSFSGGRSVEGGGGISRIRTSHQIDEQKK